MATVPSATKPGPERWRFLALVPALLLVIIGVWTARLGLNELPADAVEAELTGWRERAAQSGALPAEAQWATARATIGEALRRDPANPRLHEVAAALSLQIHRKGEGFGAIPTEALPAIQASIRLRPTSPYAWAQLAYIRYQLGKVDEAFYKALENAVDFGPGEREALLTVLDLGLAVLDQAPQAVRLRVLEAARHADRREAADVAAIAARRGKLEQVCGLPNTARTSFCRRNPTHGQSPETSVGVWFATRRTAEPLLS
jgi:tetratricopeptide (TPR) repeat protein